MPSKGQVPNAADNVVVAPWNSLEAVERVFARRGPEIAAVVMEPVLCTPVASCRGRDSWQAHRDRSSSWRTVSCSMR